MINYGRIYGAGLKFMSRLLKQFNPNLSEEEVKVKAKHLFATTKGEKGWKLNNTGCQLANSIDFPYEGQLLTRKEVRI